MRKLLRFLLGLAACGVLVFAGSQMAGYIRESRESAGLNDRIADAAVIARQTEAEENPAVWETVDRTVTEPVYAESAPIAVDFEVLWETNRDVVGWLYCEDTPINLPLVQGENNDYYLHRMLDGNWNSAGTLFLDYRNAGDFSDGNTVIYGHNMKDKSMFAVLPNYQQQSFYDEHPVMWLLTPETYYKMELVAGFVTSAASRLYSFGLPEEEQFQLVEEYLGRSGFQPAVSVEPGDRFVTLSTCSYEYDDARYVVIGKLTALD